MKNLIIFLSILLSTQLSNAGCIDGNGQVATERIELNEFTRLSLRTKAKIFLYQGNEQKIDIIAESNLIEYLNTDVNGSTWAVSFDKCVKPSKEIEIHITVKNIEKIEINAKNDLIASEVIKSDELEIEINGACDLEMNLDVKDLSTEINGAGDVKYKGIATKHDIEIRGAGDVKSFDLKSEEVDIDIKGAGDITISVANSLEVEIYGAGDVKYKGSPSKLEISRYGAGDIQKVD